MSAASRAGRGRTTETASTRVDPKRINVAVSKDTVQALQRVIEGEGVSLTEAVRRLIGYGDFVYRAVREDNAELLVKTGDSTKQVVLL